ncbi:uncharacterized protein AB675_1644 [Cyphellophora attinorum]|uniref:Uncharacterized protein n=1 Tax=Cyphellophora attinorum TaxID=1664694 RepID=A0A0N0NIZ5_9EURO|nr:uncharacterized protein AB675_1644 [Phialophora attinorum]KPI36019.1 hypothetical protein AB675_1644 [Phialophora attinorum]
MAEPESETHSAIPPTSQTTPEPRAAPDISVSPSTADISDYLLPNSPARPLQPPTTAEWWSTMPSSDSVHEQNYPAALEVYSGFSSEVRTKADTATEESQAQPPSPPQNFTFMGMDRQDPTTIDWRSISLRRPGAMPAIEADNIAKGKPGWMRAPSPHYATDRSNLPTTSRPVSPEGAPEKAEPREAGEQEVGAIEGVDYGVPTGSNRPVVFFDKPRQSQVLPVSTSPASASRQRRASSSFDKPVRGRARTPVPWLHRSPLDDEPLRQERSRSANSAPFAHHRASSIPSLPELPPDRSAFEPDIHAFHPSFLTRPIPRANNVVPSVLARSIIRPNIHEQESMFNDFLNRHLSHHGRNDDHNHTPFRSPSLPHVQMHGSSHGLYERSPYRPLTHTPTPSFTNTFGNDPRRPQTLRGLYSPVVLFRCNLCVEEDGATTYGSVERVERHLRVRHGYGGNESMSGDREGPVAESAVRESHADWYFGIDSDAVDSDAVREMEDMYGVNIRMGPEDESADGSGNANFGAAHGGHDGDADGEAQHDADDADDESDDEVPIPGTIVPGTTSTPPTPGDRWYFGRLENEKLRGRQPATRFWARPSGSGCDVGTQTDMSTAEQGGELYDDTAAAAPACGVAQGATGRLVYARMPGSFEASGYVF